MGRPSFLAGCKARRFLKKKPRPPWGKILEEDRRTYYGATIARFSPVLMGVLLLALSGSAALAQSSRASAYQAQRLLGGEIWSEVVEIENTAPSAAFPARFAATLFYFDRHLWFYTESEGTFRLSRLRRSLAGQKAKLPWLLKAAHDGFRAYSVLPSAAAGPVETPAAVGLAKGCFIESIYHLRRLAAEGRSLESARLLQFYMKKGSRISGHTVLVYKAGDNRHFVDPAFPAQAGILQQSIFPLARARQIKAARDAHEQVHLFPARDIGRVFRAQEIQVEVPAAPAASLAVSG